MERGQIAQYNSRPRITYTRQTTMDDKMKQLNKNKLHHRDKKKGTRARTHILMRMVNIIVPEKFVRVLSFTFYSQSFELEE